MVLVNKGKFRVPGAIAENEIRYASLPSFYIDRDEITVQRFRMYHADYHEKPFIEDKECPQCPAMGIDWETARAYCQWAEKRLPSEFEWEAAARGTGGNIWPWGKVFFQDYANLMGNGDGFSGPAPVASFPAGSSMFGALDMVGNVWEWVADELPERNGTPYRIAKGGGWRSSREEGVIAHRNIVPAGLKNPTFGFRCVKTIM